MAASFDKRKENFLKWLDDNKDKFICLNLDDFVGDRQKLKFQCTKCGFILEARVCLLKQGRGCPKCGINNSKKKKIN